MRVQHNISAINANRNLNGNNNAVGKSLEKLSSGYRINRAGDDAAGLAISEKMRAQISGLTQAETNCNDGVSLIQTAEGALTEVHSMLNRMVELSEQSANGTYTDETDRANLQAEVDQLKSEIDRIAESTNFNGIKLLDGSLGSSAAKGVQVDVKYGNLANNADVLTLNSATATISSIADGGDFTANPSTFTLTYSDESGNLQQKEFEFTGVSGKLSAQTGLKTALEKEFGEDYNVDFSSGKVTITAKAAGADNKFEVLKASATSNNTTVTTGAITYTEGADAYYDLDTDELGTFDGTGNADDYTVEINGEKFALVANDAAAAKLDPSVHYADDADALVTVINNKTGINATAAGNVISLKAGTVAAKDGQGLTLQIGDTSDKFNQLTVSVGDMSVSALGLKGVDISTQTGAQKAVSVIKDAINTVSSTRGSLGAMQNRLEHTINNLSVANENMTNAESRIRDTDMAKEMMTYTSKNILAQAAQSMLAQANQQPQQVLSLLQ